jgi:hypothetical protein
MKFQCSQCGIHFPEEFENTLKCTFWDEHGFPKAPVEAKKQVWDWLCSFPYDEFAIKYGVGLQLNWAGAPFIENQFQKGLPNYSKLTEKEQRQLQKDWFNFMKDTSDDGKALILMHYFTQTNKKWKKKMEK